MKSFVRIALAAVLLLAAVDRSEAQRARFTGGRGVFFPGRTGFGGTPFFPYFPYVPYLNNPIASPGNWSGLYPRYSSYPNYGSVSSYYPSGSGGGTHIVYVVPMATSTTPVQPGKPAKIEVKVPNKAELWFDGKVTAQTGASRRFVTPPLYPVMRNTYEVRASWVDESGAEIIRKHRVEVQPGESVVVDLTALGG